MKKFIKKTMTESLKKIDVQFERKDNLLIFKTNKKTLLKKYILIRNIKNKKRLEVPIENFRAEISDYELLNIRSADFPQKLDYCNIYLKTNLVKHEFLRHLKLDSDYENLYENNKDTPYILRTFNTYKGYSSLYIEKFDFKPELIKIQPFNDCFVIDGKIDFFKNIKFDSINVILRSNKFESEPFKCELINKNGKTYEFSTKIRLNPTTDFTLNIVIQLQKDNEILSESFLYGTELNYDKFEDYILTQMLYPNEDIVLYSSTKFSSLNVQMKGCSTKEYHKRLRNAAMKTRLEDFCKNLKFSENRIFFESFHGKKYAGQPKYIYEKMLELGYDKYYEFIWSYSGYLEIPGNPIIVKRGSDYYKDIISSSKYWINNISFPIDKSADSIYIQTMHGAPFKYGGADIFNDDCVRGKVLTESKNWNYLITQNDHARDTFRKAFQYPNKILNIGYPANDTFYTNNLHKIQKELKTKLKLDNIGDRKIILYAPTFRDYDIDDDHKRYFEFSLDLNRLYEELSDEYVILLRLHYIFQDNFEDLNSKFDNFIFDFSDYDEITDLFIISDILISDYSSVLFDFGHTHKPMLFFTPDIELYESKRGLYRNVKEDLPGPMLMSNDEVINALKNIDKVQMEYEDKYDKFYNKYCILGHGTATDDLINEVFRKE